MTSITCFNIKRDGYFSAKEIPTQTMAPGDTLWINHSAYWSGGGRCHDNGRFGINTLLANPNEARWISVDGHFGIIPVKEGEFTVLMVGSAQLTRNHSYVYEHHTFRIRVSVAKAYLADHPNPPDLKRAFFRIETFTLDGISQNNSSGDYFVSFAVKMIPDLTKSRDLNFHGIHVPTIELDLENGIYTDPRVRDFGLYDSKIRIRWSPIDSIRFVYVRAHNPDAWDGDAQKHIPGIVQSSRYTFGIRSHPNNVPVEQRTFEVFGFE